MGKKILVLYGSPRKKGDSARIIEAFTAGAESAGNSVVVLPVGTMQIKPCVGCLQCTKGKGTPCAIKDDMQQVYEQIETADAVVFVSPIYWFQITAQLKAAIDRLFAWVCEHQYVRGEERLPQKQGALILTCGGTEEFNYANPTSYYKDFLMKIMGWEDKGVLVAYGTEALDDAHWEAYRKQTYALGESFRH